MKLEAIASSLKITRITSHVLQCDMPEELGYSQQYYSKRTAHIVEVETDQGITGWGECFGPGNVALANKAIVEKVIQPLVLGMDPMDRDVIWHRVYNLLRDHGQKGMPLQSLSGVDIALWDIKGKALGRPVYDILTSFPGVALVQQVIEGIRIKIAISAFMNAKRNVDIY